MGKNTWLSIFLLMMVLLMTDFRAGAQSTFQRTYGTKGNDYPVAFIQTSDKGFALIGWTNNYSEMYLVRTDSLGNKIWSKGYVLGTFNNLAMDIKETQDDGFIICTQTQVLKIDSLGGVQWNREYFPYKNYAPYFYKVINASGGYVLAGGGSQFGMSLVKIDYSGNMIWTRTNGNFYWEQNSNDLIQLSYDSCFYAINGYGPYKITKFDKNGNGIWTKYIKIKGDSNPDYSVGAGYFSQIMANPDGKTISASIKEETTDEWFTFDTSGTITKSWEYTWRGSQKIYWTFYTNGSLHDIVSASDFDTALVENGPNAIGIGIERHDASGKVKWYNLFVGPKTQYPAMIRQTSDGGIAILGLTDNYGAGGDDFFLAKIDSSGSGTCHDTIVKGFYINSIPVVIDTSLTPFNYLPFPTTVTLTDTTLAVTDSSYDACKCHIPVAAFAYDSLFGQIYDSSLWGEKWYWSFGDGTYDSTGIATSHNYSGHGPYNLCLTVTNGCGSDSVCKVVYYKTEPIGINTLTDGNSVNISPNPSSGNFHITSSYTFSEIEVADVTGRIIISQQVSSKQLGINLSSLEPGIYFIRMLSTKGAVVKRVVKI
jgi:PKD repeat protein